MSVRKTTRLALPSSAPLHLRENSWTRLPRRDNRKTLSSNKSQTPSLTLITVMRKTPIRNLFTLRASTSTRTSMPWHCSPSPEKRTTTSPRLFPNRDSWSGKDRTSTRWLINRRKSQLTSTWWATVSPHAKTTQATFGHSTKSKSNRICSLTSRISTTLTHQAAFSNPHPQLVIPMIRSLLCRSSQEANQAQPKMEVSNTTTSSRLNHPRLTQSMLWLLLWTKRSSKCSSESSNTALTKVVAECSNKWSRQITTPPPKTNYHQMRASSLSASSTSCFQSSQKSWITSSETTFAKRSLR